MLDPRLLRTFVAVVDAASFTTAADRLNSTQSTVSQQLGRLEAAVGHVLVDRSARPILPTPAGERLLGYARRLPMLQDEARQLLADPSGTSTTRIGVPDDIVTRAMSERFADFARRHREIRLYVTTGLSRDLKRRFRDGEFDIAVVKAPTSDGDARSVRPEPLSWFEATDCDHRSSDPLPLVAFPAGGLYRDVMVDRLEANRTSWGSRTERFSSTGSSRNCAKPTIAASGGRPEARSPNMSPRSETGGKFVRQRQDNGHA